jgi:hypothetical protein
MDTDNTNRDAEPSLASAGSHCGGKTYEQPRFVRNCDGTVSLHWPDDRLEVTAVSRELLEHVVARVNGAAITDDDREALTYAAGALLEQFIEHGDTQDRVMSDRVRALIQRLT